VDTHPDEREEEAMASLGPIMEALGPLGVKRLERGHSGADVGPLVKQGAKGVGLGHDWAEYFDIHHTEADTFDKIDPDALAQGVAAMAVLAYGLAEQ
jgi:carboxypeptidase Q